MMYNLLINKPSTKPKILKLQQVNYSDIVNKLDELKASMAFIAETIMKIQKDRSLTEKWISEKELMSIPSVSLSRSTLLQMRKKGLLRSSTLTGKQVFYRKEDFAKLLDKNEFEM